MCIVGVRNSTLELSTARNGVDSRRAINARGDCRNSNDSHNEQKFSRKIASGKSFSGVLVRVVFVVDCKVQERARNKIHSLKSCDAMFLGENALQGDGNYIIMKLRAKSIRRCSRNKIRCGGVQ